MHLIIVEDWESDRDQLAALIREECASHKEQVDLSFYTSGEDFLAHYRPRSCDGLFLDILLDSLTGIEVARKIRETETHLPIIFTTTERDYAVDGFAVKATDYLIKPLILEQVARCMGAAAGISLRASLYFPVGALRSGAFRTRGRGAGRYYLRSVFRSCHDHLYPFRHIPHSQLFSGIYVSAPPHRTFLRLRQRAGGQSFLCNTSVGQ